MSMNELYKIISVNIYMQIIEHGYLKTKKHYKDVFENIMLEDINQELDTLDGEALAIDYQFSDIVELYKKEIESNMENIDTSIYKTEVIQNIALNILTYNCYMYDKDNYLKTREAMFEKENFSLPYTTKVNKMIDYSRRKQRKLA